MRVVPMLVVLALVAGCSSSEEGEENAAIDRCEGVVCRSGFVCETDTGDCVADPDRACASDADCDETQRCDGEVCVSRCAGVTCNEEAGEVCNPSTGACVGSNRCEVATDCPGEAQVCEGSYCVGGNLADCSARQACAAGLDCVGTAGFMRCLAPCEATTDCLVHERCVLDDGGQVGSFANHCLINFCRPGGDEYGFYQDAEYMGACDANGSGDGICIGPFPGEGESGACFGSGTAAAGAGCSATASHGDAQACSAGYCAGAEDDGMGNCLAFCSLFDGTSCDPISTISTACYPVWGVNGLCAPQVADPAAVGEACVQVGFQLACEEEAACLPDGDASSCQALCDVDAEAGAAGSCATGTCELLQPGANLHLGACTEATP